MHPGNNLTRDEAQRRAELIQTPLYDISLDLSRDSDTFACEATIHFLCQEPGANTFIDFLAPSVDSCELNGEEVPKEAFNGARITSPTFAMRTSCTCWRPANTRTSAPD